MGQRALRQGLAIVRSVHVDMVWSAHGGHRKQRAMCK